MPYSTVLTINLRTCNIDVRSKLFLGKLCIGWHQVARATLCFFDYQRPKMGICMNVTQAKHGTCIKKSQCVDDYL